MVQYLFYILSGIAIAGGLGVVFARNPIYSILCLIITFFAIAGHYVLLNAQFLAAVHVIVYAGAIMVLFLYVLMMMNLNKESETHKNIFMKIIAVVSGGLMMVLLIGALKGSEAIKRTEEATQEIGLIGNLGKVLFKDFLLPFEISSLLFLAAMIGAVMLGKKSLK